MKKYEFEDLLKAYGWKTNHENGPDFLNILDRYDNWVAIISETHAEEPYWTNHSFKTNGIDIDCLIDAINAFAHTDLKERKGNPLVLHVRPDDAKDIIKGYSGANPSENSIEFSDLHSMTLAHHIVTELGILTIRDDYDG